MSYMARVRRHKQQKDLSKVVTKRANVVERVWLNFEQQMEKKT